MKIKVKINLYTDGDYYYAYDEETGASNLLYKELEKNNQFEFVNDAYLHQAYTLSAVFNDKADAKRFISKVFCNIRVDYTHYYITEYLFTMFNDAINGLYKDDENYCYAVSGNYEGTYIDVKFEEDCINNEEETMNVYEQVMSMTMDEFRDFCFMLYNKGHNDGMGHVSDESWIWYCYPESKVLNLFDD